MKLSNKWYNVLKWLALIALQAVGIFYATLASIWSLPYGDEIKDTFNAVALLIGVLIGVSSYNYKKEK